MTKTNTYTGPENKYHVLEISISNITRYCLISTRYTECVRQMLEFNKSVAIDYYKAKSDPKTTVNDIYCTYIQHRQTHSQDISD